MNNKIYDYVVVGTGLSGLFLANRLKNHKNQEVLVLEKSRGVGGRMATRRDGTFTFDHGAQFVKNDELMESLIKEWNGKGLLRNLGENQFYALGGMTKLAKDLGASLNIELERKVSKISYANNLWAIADDESHTWTARNIILTPPVPQVVELLERSSIDYPQDLIRVKYTKALIFLVKAENGASGSPYQETMSSSIFSVSSQKLKGTSSSDAEVIVMNADWSEKYFDESDETIIEKGRVVLAQELPELKVLDLQLKKWRYAFPQTTYHQSFLSLGRGLYVSGDGFCEGDLNGALKSASSLLNEIINVKK